MRRGVYEVAGIGEIAYAYVPVGAFDTSRTTEETAQELTALGIEYFYHDGLEWNYNGKTFTDKGNAAAVGTKIVAINRKAFGDGKEFAGHEALHIWVTTEASRAYIKAFDENRVMNTPYAIERGLKVMDDYFPDGIIADKALFFEEFIAHISGHIHSGKYDDKLRTMFKDYNAVRAAWGELVKRQAGVRLSLSNSEYMAAVENGDMGAAQRSAKRKNVALTTNSKHLWRTRRRKYIVERNAEMFKERQSLLRTFTTLDTPQSTALKLIKPMKTMSEEEKEVFARSLRMKLEKGEITL